MHNTAAPLIPLKYFSNDSFHEALGSIVLTKGVYDLTHSGHIKSLWKASEFGDCLVVALASDESVHERKGKTRPIMHLQERLAVVSSLKMVDYVTVYDDTSPYSLIMTVRPHLFCASHFNYLTDLEQHSLRSLSIELRPLPRPDERSTSDIVDHILKTSAIDTSEEA